jgi:hypothetical protein
MGMKAQCQSCGMPLVSKRQGDMRGTETDGSLSTKWCKLCFENGHFTGPDCTLNQMIEIVDNALKQQNASKLMRWMAKKGIPRLERWN